MVRVEACALVLEVGRDASATEGVIAHLGGDGSRLGPPPHHLSGVAPMQPLAVEFHAGHRSCSVAALPSDHGLARQRKLEHQFWNRSSQSRMAGSTKVL